MPFISGNQNTACKFIKTHLNVNEGEDFLQMLCIKGQICKYFGGGNTAFLTSKLKLSMTLGSLSPKLFPFQPSSFDQLLLLHACRKRSKTGRWQWAIENKARPIQGTQH